MSQISVVRVRVNSAARLYSDEAEIRVTNPLGLNYEAQNQYNISVTVTGLGRTITSTLAVNVVDANEPHVIDSSTTAVSVDASAKFEHDEVPPSESVVARRRRTETEFLASV